MDIDEIMSTVVIVLFATCGLGCLYKMFRKKDVQMHKSASTENLQSIITEDPQP